jgi:hypothetical protein
MTTKTESKSAAEPMTAFVSTENTAIESQPHSVPVKINRGRNNEAVSAPEEFKLTLSQLDQKRTELAKNAIEQLRPGRPFDPTAVRKINEIERKKNRLIVSRLAYLLRSDSPSVQAIVHQIIEL